MSSRSRAFPWWGARHPPDYSAPWYGPPLPPRNYVLIVAPAEDRLSDELFYELFKGILD